MRGKRANATHYRAVRANSPLIRLFEPPSPKGGRQISFFTLPLCHQRRSHSGECLARIGDGGDIRRGQAVGLFVAQHTLQHALGFFYLAAGRTVQRLAGLAAQRGVGPVFRLMGRTVKNALRKRKESAR